MEDFKIETAARMKRLPPYLFGRLNALKLEKRRQDIDIIDLGMGNPMDGAPDLVTDKLCESRTLAIIVTVFPRVFIISVERWR